jgi:hypothetical protein
VSSDSSRREDATHDVRIVALSPYAYLKTRNRHSLVAVQFSVCMAVLGSGPKATGLIWDSACVFEITFETVIRLDLTYPAMLRLNRDVEVG